MAFTGETIASKQRLVLELLALLRRKDAPDEDASAGPLQLTESVAQSHQKRLNRRFRQPALRVLIGAQTYKTIDWSLGGLMVADYVGDLKLHARFSLSMSDQAKDGVYYAAEGRVTRLDRTGRTLGLQFNSLSKGGFEWLSGLQLQQRARRRASGA